MKHPPLKCAPRAALSMLMLAGVGVLAVAAILAVATALGVAASTRGAWAILAAIAVVAWRGISGRRRQCGAVPRTFSPISRCSSTTPSGGRGSPRLSVCLLPSRPRRTTPARRWRTGRKLSRRCPTTRLGTVPGVRWTCSAIPTARSAASMSRVPGPATACRRSSGRSGRGLRTRAVARRTRAGMDFELGDDRGQTCDQGCIVGRSTLERGRDRWSARRLDSKPAQ
jgi:hypothetical protein